jgi:hypothetical protein
MVGLAIAAIAFRTALGSLLALVTAAMVGRLHADFGTVDRVRPVRVCGVTPGQWRGRWR